MDNSTLNKLAALIQGFSDDLKKKDTPIVAAISLVDLHDGTLVILQAIESLYLPNGKYTILSVTQ